MSTTDQDTRSQEEEWEAREHAPTGTLISERMLTFVGTAEALMALLETTVIQMALQIFVSAVSRVSALHLPSEAITVIAVALQALYILYRFTNLFSLVPAPLPKWFGLHLPSSAIPLNVLLFVTLQLSIFAATFALQRALDLTPIFTTANIFKPTTGSLKLNYILMMTITAPISEELVFRGLLFYTLRRSSDLSPLYILLQVTVGCVYGVLLGKFFTQTNTILTTMFVHIVNNSLSLAIPFGLDDLTSNPLLIGYYYEREEIVQKLADLIRTHYTGGGTTAEEILQKAKGMEAKIYMKPHGSNPNLDKFVLPLNNVVLAYNKQEALPPAEQNHTEMESLRKQQPQANPFKPMANNNMVPANNNNPPLPIGRQQVQPQPQPQLQGKIPPQHPGAMAEYAQYWEICNRLKEFLPVMESLVQKVEASKSVDARTRKIIDMVHLVRQTPETATHPLRLDDMMLADKTLTQVHKNYNQSSQNEAEQFKSVMNSFGALSNEALFAAEKDILCSFERSKRFFPDTYLDKTAGVVSRPLILWFKNPIIHNPFISAPSSKDIRPKKKHSSLFSEPDSASNPKKPETQESNRFFMNSLKKDLLNITKSDNTLLPAKLIDNDTIVISEILNAKSKNLYIHFQTAEISPSWKGSISNPPLFILKSPLIQISTDGDLYSIQPLCKHPWDTATNVIALYKQSLIRGDSIHDEIAKIQERNLYLIEARIDEKQAKLFLHFSFNKQSKKPPITLIMEIPDHYPNQPVSIHFPPEYDLSPFLKDLLKNIRDEFNNGVNNNSNNQVASPTTITKNNNTGRINDDKIIHRHGTIFKTLEIFEKIIDGIDK
eukprot:gene15942-18951_t